MQRVIIPSDDEKSSETERLKQQERMLRERITNFRVGDSESREGIRDREA